MTNTVRLVDDAGATLVQFTDDDTQAILTGLDLGFPAVREATTPLSGQDGEYDVTSYVGSRAVVAEVGFMPQNAAVNMDTLRALMHPGRRMWLYVFMDGWDAERMLRVRGASFAASTAALPWTAQLGWKAAVPTWQDVTLSSDVLSPALQPGGGMSLSVSLPASFSAGLSPGASLLTVSGTVPASPIIDIYGPCTGPVFRNVDTGAQLSFSGLSIASGDYLHIDVAARTITLNNNPAQPAYDRLDFDVSSWPVLDPGVVQVVFSPASMSGGCVAVVSWRAQWL